jgi:hypothetical protein
MRRDTIISDHRCNSGNRNCVAGEQIADNEQHPGTAPSFMGALLQPRPENAECYNGHKDGNRGLSWWQLTATTLFECPYVQWLPGALL